MIVFSKHAIERIRERNINEELVATAIRAPDLVYAKGAEKTAIKKLGKRVLLVVYKSDAGIDFIITVIASSKADKYMK